MIGAIACESEQAWTDDAGSHLARINTDRPWHIESTRGEIRFVVFASQFTD